MKIQERINLLPDVKINKIYNIPNLTEQDIELFFNLSKDDYVLLNKYRTLRNQIYFIIQLVYFRATQAFYNFDLEEIPEQVLCVYHRYFDEPESLNTLVAKPYREIIKSQQAVILNLYEYQDWSPSFAPQIEVHLRQLIQYYPKPEVATLESLKYFEQIKVVIPSYRVLQDIYSKVLAEHEEKLNNLILAMPFF